MTDDEKPRALTCSVAELVRDAWRGRLRVPDFQRHIKWQADDVAMLLDSLYRGYPVGALLLWQGRPEVPGEEVRVGHVRVDDPDGRHTPSWIVDGQQRVTALALSLTPDGWDDRRYRIWFDPEGETFHPEPASGAAPGWFPVHHLLDGERLGDVLEDWPTITRDARKVIHAAGARIRDFRLPAYVITSTDDGPLRVMYHRANQQGKRLKQEEVFNALMPNGGRTVDLVELVAAEGWGDVDHRALLSAATIDVGRDPTHKGDLHDLSRWTSPRAGVMRDAVLATVRFLRDEALIPTAALLPYQLPLMVLPAFFARHPKPSPRNLRLLRRWVWRSFLVDQGNRPGELRAAASAARADGVDEDAVVQRLLSLVPAADPAPWTMPGTFRVNAADVKLGLLGLASLQPPTLGGDLGTLPRKTKDGPEFDATREDGPRSPVAPWSVDLVALFGTQRSLPRLTTRTDVNGHDTLANRVLHPTLRGLPRALAEAPPEIAARHAIDSATQAALRAGDLDGALRARGAAIERVTRALIDRCAEWGAHDRPSLRAIFAA